MADANTLVLLHCDGTDASANKVVTTASAAQVDTAQSKFGGASGLFPGDDDYLTVPDNAAWDLTATESFTIDFWVKRNGDQVDYAAVLQRGDNSSPYNGWTIQFAPSGVGTNKIRLVNNADGSGGVVSSDALGTDWTHVAVVHDDVNDKLYLFVNGTKVDEETASTAINWTNVSEALFIGSQNGFESTREFNGWLDEIRISKGVARWTSDFTPPVAQYSTDSYTELLLHCDGADASNVFADTSATEDAVDYTRAINFVGNAQLDTAQKKFGTASLLLDGTGDYISTPHNANLNFGTANFTIDFWIRWNDKSGEQMFFDKSVDANDRWIFYKSATDTISFSATIGSVTKANYVTASALTLADDTWYHFALVRNSATMLLFLNGVSQTLTETTAVGTNNFGDNTGNLFIGMFRDGSTDPINGWFDEVRISNVARWTTNFTPPVNEYDFVATTTGAFAAYLEV